MKIISQSPNKAYKKINSYSHKPSPEQIATLLLFILHLILHSIFVVSIIIAINQTVLSFLLALFYFLVVLMIGLYIMTTTIDPVDDLVRSDKQIISNKIKYKKYQASTFQRQNEMRSNNSIVIRGTVVHSQYNNSLNPYSTTFCIRCKRTSLKSSYHCSTCDRCVKGMDHHCKYLNNCVGIKNYMPFFLLLIVATLYLLVAIGHTIWVFVAVSIAENDADNNTIVNAIVGTKWMSIVILIYSVILLIAVDSLLIFHFYINCIRNMTTIEYLFRETPSNISSQSSESANQMNTDHNLELEPQQQGMKFS